MEMKLRFFEESRAGKKDTSKGWIFGGFMKTDIEMSLSNRQRRIVLLFGYLQCWQHCFVYNKWKWSRLFGVNFTFCLVTPTH